MKDFIPCIILIILLIVYKIVPTAARQQQNDGYILEHEKDIAVEEPGTLKVEA